MCNKLVFLQLLQPDWCITKVAEYFKGIKFMGSKEIFGNVRTQLRVE